MLRLRSFAFASMLLMGGLVACSSSSSDDKEPVAETSQEITKSQLKIVGSLDYGKASPVTSYKNPPRYVAFKFAGNEGDAVDVWVKSNNGDPVTWILDNDFHIVAVNDDASKTDTNSHVTVTLPKNASATHYIVVRDYWLDNMTFKVTLAGKPADLAAGCNVDADCAKIEKGCCALGNFIAIRTDNVQAYKDALACQTPQICPKIAVRPDYSAAECNNQTHKCELVKPADIRCGSFIMNSHACPDGYRCQLTPGLPDVGGKCVQFCGGIAGIPCHGDNEVCVDDPNDGCDPANGGADCGGICQTKTVQHCGGFAAIPCTNPNDECVDDPSDSCDPANGGADCGGICQPK